MCIFRVFCDFGYSVEIIFGGNWEVCFDNVDVYVIEYFCDFEFFFMGYGCVRVLFVVV